MPQDDLAADKALVERYCQAFYNDKDFDLARSMLTEDFANHHPGVGTGPDRTVSSFREQVADRFPDFTLEIRRMVADGDQVWTYGLVRLVPGPPVAVTVDIWRVADGRLAEHWDVGQRITEETHPDELLP